MTSPNQLSFLPEDYLENKSRKRTNVICLVLFLVVMVAIHTVFTMMHRRVTEAERKHAAVMKEYADEGKRLQQVKEMQSKQRVMAQQAELTASLLEKVPRSNLLAKITDAAIPSHVSLLDLTLSSKKKNTGASTAQPKTLYEMRKAEREKKTAAPAPPQPIAYDVNLSLIGIADNDVQVSQFMSRLSACKLFREVNLSYTDQFKDEEERILRKFQIEMTLDPNVDIESILAESKSQVSEVADIK